MLWAAVAAAVIGMSVYTMRALCGRWRTGMDTFGHGRQYEKGITTVVITP